MGFGFGVVWMTAGLGAAIVCLLLAAMGYGAVCMAERAEANRKLAQAQEVLPIQPDGIEIGDERYDEVPDDATTSPLAAEVEYGWPWPGEGEGEAQSKPDPVPVTSERA